MYICKNKIKQIMERTSNKTLRILLILIGIPIALYISTLVWIHKRTFFEKLTYKPLTEQKALEHAFLMKTVLPTELHVISGSDETKVSVPAGTNVKYLGVYMRMLNFRSDYYCEASPTFYSPDQYFFIELPDGTRGAAILPEMIIGKEIVTNSGDTLTVSGIRKNNSSDRFPYDFLVNSNSQTYKWDGFECVYDTKETVVYTCPLLKLNESQRHKVARVPKFIKIPTHSDDGFFLFPRFKKWNMYMILPWWRGSLMRDIYWFLLLVVVLWRLGAWSIRISIRADKKYLTPEYDSVEAYNKVVGYYWPRFYLRAFIAGCIFSPLIWLWTRLYTKSVFDGLEKDIKNRCPKCRKVGLKTEPTGKKTEEQFVGQCSYTPEPTTRVTGKVWDPNMDKGFGTGGYRENTETTYFNTVVYDDYVHREEYRTYCPHCGFSMKNWRTVHTAKNSRGGDVRRVEASTWRK